VYGPCYNRVGVWLEDIKRSIKPYKTFRVDYTFVPFGFLSNSAKCTFCVAYLRRRIVKFAS
jgi:hypothetical protein